MRCIVCAKRVKRKKKWEDLPWVPISSLVAALEQEGISHIEAIRLANKMYVTEEEYNKRLEEDDEGIYF